MQTIPSLTIDEQPLPLSQAFKYLRTSGGLKRVLDEIKRQHLLEREIKERDNIKVMAIEVEKAISAFQGQYQLTNPVRFTEWLNQNEKRYEDLYQEVKFALKVSKLKESVISPNQIQQHFKENPEEFKRMVLSRIIVADRTKAEELKQQIDSQEQSFETLARKHSIAQEANANGMMGPVRVSTLPDAIKTALENPTPGEAIGPVEFEGTYGLFRVDEVLPEPKLNDSLKQNIRNQLFEKWLQDKLTKMTLTLEMD